MINPVLAPGEREMSRRGIGLAEVLVTIGILSVVIAIIVPAVMQARATSRRAACKARLQQIGVAAASYESSHRHYMHEFDSEGRKLEPLVTLMHLLDLANEKRATLKHRETKPGYPAGSTNGSTLAGTVSER